MNEDNLVIIEIKSITTNKINYHFGYSISQDIIKKYNGEIPLAMDGGDILEGLLESNKLHQPINNLIHYARMDPTFSWSEEEEVDSYITFYQPLIFLLYADIGYYTSPVGIVHQLEKPPTQSFINTIYSRLNSTLFEAGLYDIRRRLIYYTFIDTEITPDPVLTEYNIKMERFFNKYKNKYIKLVASHLPSHLKQSKLTNKIATQVVNKTIGIKENIASGKYKSRKKRRRQRKSRRR